MPHLQTFHTATLSSLPSQRGTGTTDAALRRTLEEEVLTKTIHGKGTFVLAVNKDLLEEAKKEIEEYLEKALQKAKQSGVSHKEVKELLELLMEE